MPLLYGAPNNLGLGTLTVIQYRARRLGWGFGGRRVRVVLDYTVTSRPLWDTTGPVSKRTVVLRC